MQYVKIKESIVEQIEAGRLSPRQKLPAERKLAESFDTTRVTLREALSLLEAEGRIYREDRRGWFISPAPLRYDPMCSTSFEKMALNQNRVPKTEVVIQKSILADKQATRLLALDPFADVYRVDSVRYLDDRPVVYVTTYIHSETFPNLLKCDLTGTLDNIYKEKYGVECHKVRYRISTSSLLGDVAQMLRSTSCAPTMVVERIKYNQNDLPLEATIEYWRHDAILIESSSKLTD